MLNGINGPRKFARAQGTCVCIECGHVTSLVLDLGGLCIVSNFKFTKDEQTAQQQALFAYHQQKAQAASAAATNDVLRFLD